MKRQLAFMGMALFLIFTLSLTVLAADPIFMYAAEGKNNGMVLTDSAESYSGKYVSGFKDGTSIDYTFNIAEAGDYIVWARVFAAFDNSNSLLYRMDQKASAKSVTLADNINTFDMRDALWGEQDVINPNRPAWDNFYNPDLHNSEEWYNIWYWMPIGYRGVSDEISFYKYSTDMFSLGAGDHTLTIYTRISEPDARFDMFIVTNDLTYDPNNVNGDPKAAWAAAHPAAQEQPPAETDYASEPAVQEPAAPAPSAPKTGDTGIAVIFALALAVTVSFVKIRKKAE